MEQNKKSNTNNQDGYTELMKPVTEEMLDKRREYSYKNDSSKIKGKKQKKVKYQNKHHNDAQETQLLSAVPESTSKTKKKGNPRSQNSKDETKETTEVKKSAETTKDVTRIYLKAGTALFGFACVLLLGIGMFGMPYPSNTNSNNSKATTSYASSYKDDTNSASTDNACVHEWEEVKSTVHHDAVTHDVNHDAEYKTVTKYHTVCNVCGEQIDNNIAAHKEATGHYSWTTDVPFYEQELVKAAYTQTVTDQAAYDEQIVIGRKCSKCGKAEIYS